MSKPAGVLCVGRVYCDLVFTGVPRAPSMGTEVFAEGVALHAGGGAFIAAAYFAALGRPSFLAATLSGPPFGALLRAQSEDAKIDISLCTAANKDDDPQITAVMVGAKDRAFLTRCSGVAAPVPSAQALSARGIGHMHIGELRTALELPRLIAVARAAGVTVSLDCGWEDWIDPSAAETIAGVNVFLPNEVEFAHLSAAGIEVDSPLCVIKQGQKGAKVLGGISRPSKPVETLDTTGAGDAFNAGFLHAWLNQKPVSDCLELGNACGAAAVQYAGGCGGTREVADSLEMAAQ